MKDTIYRQDAIDAMTNTLWHYPNECYRNLNEYKFAKGLAELGLKSVPSAQPEITDIQAIEQLQASGWMQNHDKQMYEMGLREQLANDNDSYDALLPPAQPEPLTDKEQRIFLAAMRREEEVCKQVDDECRNCREPYENSLVRTCREITRKVKGALWMIQSADKLQ